MIGKIKNYLLKIFPFGGFAKHVATLMTGTVLAGVIGIVVMPILTRIYKPEDFGIFALYTSLLGILTVVVCWRYELAIVLPEKDEDAANLLWTCIIICLGMGLAVFLLVFMFRTVIADLVNAPQLTSWLWFLPLSLMTAGFFRLLNYWSTRRKHFKRLAARQITQSGVTAITQIGAGLFYPLMSAGGLIGGALAGHMTATGRLAWQIKKDEGLFIRNALNKFDLDRVVKRYKNFPIFDVWSALLNTASTMLPALLLGFFFSPVVVGFYALGHQILSAPMTILGASIAQVFFPRANEAKRSGNLDQLTLQIFKQLLAIGFVPILLLTIIAPDLFSLVFGTRWFTAGEYVRWLSVWFLFVFISSPLSNIYAIMEKQREGLIVNTVMFVSRLTVLIIGGLKGDAYFTIAIYGMTGAALWIFNCIYMQHLAGVSLINIFITLLKQFLHGLPYALLPIFTYFLTKNSLAFLLGGVSAGIIFLMMQIYRIRKPHEFA
ncbi:MAG: oligosaccharide flippase family protein [Syntrophaceae bacterium]|nr:oligosaccharide flippase family protein [Syntrophaceae bacterium]